MIKCNHYVVVRDFNMDDTYVRIMTDAHPATRQHYAVAAAAAKTEGFEGPFIGRLEGLLVQSERLFSFTDRVLENDIADRPDLTKNYIDYAHYCAFVENEGKRFKQYMRTTIDPDQDVVRFFRRNGVMPRNNEHKPQPSMASPSIALKIIGWVIRQW